MGSSAQPTSRQAPQKCQHVAAGINSTYQQPRRPFQTPPKLKVLKATDKHQMTACDAVAAHCFDMTHQHL